MFKPVSLLLGSLLLVSTSFVSVQAQTPTPPKKMSVLKVTVIQDEKPTIVTEVPGSYNARFTVGKDSTVTYDSKAGTSTMKGDVVIVVSNQGKEILSMNLKDAVVRVEYPEYR